MKFLKILFSSKYFEKEIKEKENIVGNKQKLEKVDADKDGLKHKRRRIMESPTQSPLPSPDSPDFTPPPTSVPSPSKNQLEIRPTESPIPNLPDLSPPPRVRINLFYLLFTCFVNPLIHMFLSIYIMIKQLLLPH